MFFKNLIVQYGKYDIIYSDCAKIQNLLSNFQISTIILRDVIQPKKI